jgi:hypothetical protein
MRTRGRKKLSYKVTDKGCWEVTSHVKNSRGYVSLHWDGMYFAHRWQWVKFNGKIPDDMNVCHHCDNPSCINPDHLFLGTDRDNIRDMMEKGRSRRKTLRIWQEIKDNPHAVYLENNVGYLKRTKWINEIGFTLKQIGDYMGITRERARQLISKSSPRILCAVEEMKDYAKSGKYNENKSK